MINTDRPRPRIPLPPFSPPSTGPRVSKIRIGANGHYEELWGVWEEEDLGESNNHGLLATFDTGTEALAYLKNFLRWREWEEWELSSRLNEPERWASACPRSSDLV